MKKRLLACVLVLSLLLNLSVAAFASDLDDPLPVEYVDSILIDDVFSDDIKVNPEDFVMNSGVSVGSLGLTLTMGQIAALIAGGAGAIYAVSNFDDLGRHLQNALDTAAAAVPSGVDVLAQWTAKAVNGDIALASAPSWIATTILQVMHGLVTSISPLIGQPFAGQSAAAVESFKVVPAGSPVYAGVPRVNSITGEVTRRYYTFDCDVVPIVATNIVSGYAYCWTAVSPVNGESNGTVLCSNGSSYSLWSSSFERTSITISATGQTRYAFYISGESMSHDEEFEQKNFSTYCLPGSITHSSDIFGKGSMLTYFTKYYNGTLVNPSYDYPEGEAVDPGILVGGLPEVWLGQGLGADVITFPDIMLDGSTVLNPDTTLEGDAAWDVAIDGALEDLKTGELSWSDYWLDISDSVPVAKVEDETTGDIVDRPIGDDGSLKDPVVVPEYSTDPHEYSIDLKRFFPFCIPFDLYDFLSCLAADPETPKINFVFPYLDGQEFPLEIDLSPYDDVAQIVRNLELFAFVILLATVTRDKMIKG